MVKLFSGIEFRLFFLDDSYGVGLLTLSSIKAINCKGTRIFFGGGLRRKQMGGEYSLFAKAVTYNIWGRKREKHWNKK